MEQDGGLKHRTLMTVEHIISLMEFCLKTICFQFQDRFFEQLKGAAMESPFSLIVGNHFMEDFMIKTINSAKHPPSVWKRYVNDIFDY